MIPYFPPDPVMQELAQDIERTREQIRQAFMPVDAYCYLDAYWEACQAFAWLHFWERFGRLVIRRESMINMDAYIT